MKRHSPADFDDGSFQGADDIGNNILFSERRMMDILFII